VDIVPLPDFLPDWTLWVLGPPVLAMLIFGRVWQVRDRRRQAERRVAGSRSQTPGGEATTLGGPSPALSVPSSWEAERESRFPDLGERSLMHPERGTERRFEFLPQKARAPNCRRRAHPLPRGRLVEPLTRRA
jgi:hypothetical protein